MNQLILPAEVAAAIARPAMPLRFVPVTDTYTEGERIQIVTLCADDGHPVVFWCPPGCDGHPVVATATVARVLPIVDGSESTGPRWHPSVFPCLEVSGNTVTHWTHHDAGFADISDHLPFVTFTPGGKAIELTNVEATP